MVMISMIMAITALGVDLLLPAFDEVRAEFGLGADSTRPALILTVYFAGLAIAQLFWGPMADRFGRRPILWSALGIYGLGTLAAGLAPTFEILLASRLLWGIGAAGTRVVAIAVIRDLYEGDEMAAFMSRIMAIFLIVPVIAPLLGAAVLEVADWRWLFWLTLLLAASLGIWTSKIPETLDPAHRLPLQWRAVGTAFARTFTTPVTLAYTLATVFMQGAFSSYLASSELVLDTVFDRGSQFPVVFAVIAAVLGGASLGAARVVKTIGGATMVARALPLGVLAATVALVVTLLADGRPNFWIYIALLTVQLGIHVALIPTLNSLALVPMGDIAGTAASVTGALRVAAGGFFGAIVDQQIDDTTRPWAIAFLVGSIAALIATRTVRSQAELAP